MLSLSFFLYQIKAMLKKKSPNCTYLSFNRLPFVLSNYLFLFYIYLFLSVLGQIMWV